MSLFEKMFGQRHQHTTDSPELIRQNIADGKAIMLDVRSQEEFDAGHLKDVVFIPFDEVQAIEPGTEEIEGLDKDKIIYCHWKAGGRAAVAAGIFAPMGYEIRTIKDSFEALVGKGFEPA